MRALRQAPSCDRVSTVEELCQLVELVGGFDVLPEHDSASDLNPAESLEAALSAQTAHLWMDTPDAGNPQAGTSEPMAEIFLQSHEPSN